jgi:hypothetical protein
MENFSEKRKRGRPRLSIASEKACAVSGLEIGCQTRRGKQNYWYAMDCIHALRDDPQFHWLWNAELAAKGQMKLPFSILAALGRLQDPELIRAMALQICQMDPKPKARDAIVSIRRVRISKDRPPSTDKLSDAIITVVDDYWFRHPDATPALILDALQTVADLVSDLPPRVTAGV